MVPSSRWTAPFASVVNVLMAEPAVFSDNVNTAPLTGSLDQRPWPGWPM